MKRKKANQASGPDRGYSGLARVLAVLVLLVTAATGAWAVAWTGGTYTATTNEDLSAINVSSDATLTINSNVTVTVNGGITIASGATLTVKGPGTLEVKGGNGNDGSSGGQYGGPGGNGGAAVSGTIVVQDGANVTATGGKGGNGGVGWELSGNGGNGGAAFSGAVTIYGGTISASGGNGGDGDCGSGDGSDGGPGGYAFAGTLTYYGGSVTATGGNGGGGIGGDANPGKAFANAGSVDIQANYILTSNGRAIQTIGGQKQITIAPPPVAVTGVTLPATATVTLGDPVALTAAVAPADASDKKVKWTVTAGTDKVKLYTDADCKTEVGTDATDVLTVYVKGLAVGEATVKVESNEDETKTATCTVTAKHGTYAVAMKAGVTDGDQWTARAGGSGAFAAMPLKGVEGGTKPVELKYAGDREVKRVTMRVVPTWKGDLSKLSATELEDDGVTVLVKNGMTLTGTLSENYKITIADGATVTLDGATINGVDNAYDDNFNWAGITCLGTATIVLKDGTENTVNGFFRNYPGIYVPAGSTLTIQGGTEGTGKLTASSSGLGAGIGGAVGIPCGNISITGGTVTATGGSNSPGIGGGYNASCGNITITDGVTKVTATKGDSSAPYSIGASNGGSCGTVTIGGVVYWQDNAAVGDGATYLAQDEIEYPAPAVIDLSMVDCAGTARTDGQWTANCYMVHTAGGYKLPLVYGNAIKAGETNAAAYTGVENANTTLTFPRHDGEAITAPWIKDNGITVTQAELLWQDAEGLVTKVGISGDYLTLTVGKDAAMQEGNALVAAKDGDGNVVWSWHIWVTRQTFAAADLTTVATGGSHDYKVTPVNLGWVGDTKSQGTNTFYQWGRKDPFKGTGAVTFDDSTPATIADNIKNPATLYNVNYKPSNTTYRNMWDAQQTGTDAIATATVKTVYDPSPAGFCVPTGNLYYYIVNGSGVSFGWDGTNKGRNLTSVTPNVFFPASGYRSDSNGYLSVVGSYGYYWSASALGSNNSSARNLYFSSGGRYWFNDYRSVGFPVRAVAE